MLTSEAKYNDWLLEYVDAWRERDRAPTAASSPPTSASTARSAARPAASGTAASTAGASRSIDPADRASWPTATRIHLRPDRLRQRLPADRRRPLPRRLAEADRRVNAQTKDGRRQRRSIRTCTATRAGTTSRRSRTRTARWSSGTGRCSPRTAPRCRRAGWLGLPRRARTPAIPEQALRRDLDAIRRKVAGDAARHDHARHAPGRRPDASSTRRTVGTLVELMLGGIHPRQRRARLHCRVRYFDPEPRRGRPARGRRRRWSRR